MWSSCCTLLPSRERQGEAQSTRCFRIDFSSLGNRIPWDLPELYEVGASLQQPYSSQSDHL